MRYRCATCGAVHEGLPDLAFAMPCYVQRMSEAERVQRVWRTDDLCVVDDAHFFIRGVVEVPVHDRAVPFGFGAWVSQKEEHFRRYAANPDAADLGPYVGWLSSEIAWYAPSTLHLKARAHFRGGGQRPRIEVEPCGHPLAVDQQAGITLDMAWRIIHHALDASPEGR